MTFAAKIALVDFAHIHFVAALLHLKNLVVAACAFKTLAVDMRIMTEYNRAGILRLEGDIASANLFSKRGKRNQHAENKSKQNTLFHCYPLRQSFTAFSRSL